MKKKSEIYQKWINAAYDEFAIVGPVFSLKALSVKTGLPRSTFYYYFDNKEHLIDELLKVHQQVADKLYADLELKFTKLIPDLYEIMYSHKEGVRFQQQLFRNRHIDKYNYLYSSIHDRCINFLLPFIKDYFELNNSNQEIVDFYHALTDAWYSRLNFNTLSVESMTNLALELMENFASVLKKSQATI